MPIILAACHLLIYSAATRIVYALPDSTLPRLINYRPLYVLF